MRTDCMCEFDDFHEVLKAQLASADSVEARLAALGRSAHFRGASPTELLHELQQLFAEHFELHQLACAFLVAQLVYRIEREPDAFHETDRKLLALNQLARAWLPDAWGQLEQLLRSTGEVTFMLPKMRLVRISWTQWVNEVLMKLLCPLIAIDFRIWAFWGRSEHGDDSAYAGQTFLQPDRFPRLEWGTFLATRRLLNDWLIEKYADKQREEAATRGGGGPAEPDSTEEPDEPKASEGVAEGAATAPPGSVFDQLPAARLDDAVLAERIVAKLRRTVLQRLQLDCQLIRDATHMRQAAFKRSVQQWADQALRQWKATIESEVRDYFEQYRRVRETGKDAQTPPPASKAAE